MIEIRLHGRGGQGAVVASMVLAHAARRRGYHVQVFPEFGVERRGAPVAAYARLSDKRIRLRTRVTTPDHLIVLDAALVKQVDVTVGLRAGGIIVLNAEDEGASAGLSEQYRVAWVNATAIAARHGIGTPTAPIVNTTIMGAFAIATELVTLENVEAGIADVIPKAAESNSAAAREAAQAIQWTVPFATRALQGMFAAGPETDA
jgi:pyruvate ferredoxin oxidoreductase gamma subunit/2-oxoisovalerate ferredoxin oxidoreductase gamma subunit